MSDRTARLCERARAGDATAASELVALHYERVYAFLRRLCGSEADAEDLTQKTFAKVWGSFQTFEGRSSFSTWIHGISRNVYVDWCRKGNRLDSRTDEWWESHAADGPGPFENAVEREHAGQLYAWVEQLDETTRETVHLHYYQGLSIRETAEALNIAESTVKYRLRGALDFLKSKAAGPKVPAT